MNNAHTWRDKMQIAEEKYRKKRKERQDTNLKLTPTVTQIWKNRPSTVGLLLALLTWNRNRSPIKDTKYIPIWKPSITSLSIACIFMFISLFFIVVFPCLMIHICWLTVASHTQVISARFSENLFILLLRALLLLLSLSRDSVSVQANLMI